MLQTGHMNQHESNESGSPRRVRELWLVLLVAALVVLSSFSTVDRIAEREYEQLFQRALVTFALARTLNGVISAVQGTELALQPAGVGVTLTPGEILDPVNDLVERFSWIMLTATLSLGVQQILIDAGQWWGMKLLVALLAMAWLAIRWRRQQGNAKSGLRIESILLRALLVTLFLRFAAPLAMIANEAVYDLFLDSRYTESTQVIVSAGAEMEPLRASNEELPAESGFLDLIERGFDNTRESLDFTKQLDIIGQRASEMVEHFLQLAVVFIFQTGVLPIAFLWIFLQIFRKIIQNNN